VVYEVRKILKQKSIGHAGTLDPMARGLLVLLCGSATKLSSFFLNQNKRYLLSLKFGLETNSFDLKGQILKSEAVSLKKETIISVITQETKDLELPVPIFSAVKIKGRPLYKYALKKQTHLALPVKKMSFWNLDIHEVQKDSVSLSVSCSKGSYIRSWVHHLGQKIQTGACLTKLYRVRSGDFQLKNSIKLPDLKKTLSKNSPKNEQELKQLLGNSFLFSHPALKQMPYIELTKKHLQLLKQGRLDSYLITESQIHQIQTNKKGQKQIIKAVRDNRVFALLELRPFKKIRILRNLY